MPARSLARPNRPVVGDDVLMQHAGQTFTPDTSNADRRDTFSGAAA